MITIKNSPVTNKFNRAALGVLALPWHRKSISFSCLPA
jgi:hypothetical protein